MSTTPAALAPDIEAGLRRLRLGAMRRLCPELLVLAKTQRWKPEEFLRTLIEAEIACVTRRTPESPPSGRFPVTKILDEFDVGLVGQAGNVRLPGEPRMDRGQGESVSGGPSGDGQVTFSSPSDTAPSRREGGCATSAPLISSRPFTPGWPTTPSAGSSSRS